MRLFVAKFGGTSLGSIDLIKNAAKLIKERVDSGEKIIVVTSAMSGHTNKLISLCKDISNLDSNEKKFDYDAALSTGETLAANLFSLALKEIGVNSRAFQAWQIGMISNNIPNNALIKKIDEEILLSTVAEGVVPVVTGFQAISEYNLTTTIGRGGSDTTASAIAAAVNAESCDIYTDVDGVYSTDPRFTSSARIIDKLSFDEAIELSGSGAKVLHPRSIEICRKFAINIRIISTFTQKCGTLIMKEIDESRNISGINIIRNLKIFDINFNGILLQDFIKLLDDSNINIFQILSSSRNSIKLSIMNEYCSNLEKLIDENNLGCKIIDKLSCITIVGASVRHDISVFNKILNVINKLNIEVVSAINTEIKIALYLPQEGSEIVVKQLHKEFIENV